MLIRMRNAIWQSGTQRKSFDPVERTLTMQQQRRVRARGLHKSLMARCGKASYCLGLLVAFGAGAGLTTDASAAVTLTNNDLDFSWSGSMWDGSAGGTFSASKELALSWNDVSASIGGIAQTALGDYGLQVSGTTSGKVGLLVGMQATSGDFAARVPLNVQLSFADTLRPGTLGRVNAKVSLDPNLGFTTQSPNFGFKADMIFGLQASVSGKACVVACAGFDNISLVNIAEKTYPIISVNMGNQPNTFDDKVRVFGNDITPYVKQQIGQEVALVRNSVGGAPIVSTQYGKTGQTQLLPQIQTTSALNAAGQSAASGEATLMTVKVDVGQAAAELAKLPPPAGSVGGFLRKYRPGTSDVVLKVADEISYELFSAKIGAAVKFQQDFTMQTPDEFWIDLVIAGQKQTIRAGLGNGIDSDFFIPTSLIEDADGQAQISATVRFGALSFSNLTSLAVDPILEFSALSLGLGPLQLGPVVETFSSLATPRIPVFNSSFQLAGGSRDVGQTNIGIDVSPTLVNEPNLALYTGGTTVFNTSTVANGATIQSNANGPEVVFDRSTLSLLPGARLKLGTRLRLAGRSTLRAEGGVDDYFNLEGSGAPLFVDVGVIANARLEGSMPIFVRGRLELQHADFGYRRLGSDGYAQVYLDRGSMLLMTDSSVEQVTDPLSYQNTLLEVTGGNNRIGNLTINGEVDVRTGSLVIGTDLSSTNTARVTRLGEQTRLTLLEGSYTAAGAAQHLMTMARGSTLALGAGGALINTRIEPGATAGGQLLMAQRSRLEAVDAQPVLGVNALRSLQVSGAATITASRLHLDGPMTVLAGGSADLSDTQIAGNGVANAGRIVARRNVSFFGDFDNQAGANFELLSSQVRVDGNVTNNGGTITFAAAPQLTSGTIRNNAGNMVVNALDGGLSVGAGGEIVIAGGTLQLQTGSRVLGSVRNEGGTVQVDPKGFGDSSTIFAGDYLQGRAGVLELTMDSFDAGSAFFIQGVASLDGMLRVLPTFELGSPVEGFAFTALSFLSHIGSFSAFDLPDLGEGFTWQAQYSDTSVGFAVATLGALSETVLDLSGLPESRAPTLLAVSRVEIPFDLPTAPVPEPSTWLLMFAGCAGLWLQLRRRATAR